MAIGTDVVAIGGGIIVVVIGDHVTGRRHQRASSTVVSNERYGVMNYQKL